MGRGVGCCDIVGGLVGYDVGAVVGFTVGLLVGLPGLTVGNLVGAGVGWPIKNVGEQVGEMVGRTVGIGVGRLVGVPALYVGVLDGACERVTTVDSNPTNAACTFASVGLAARLCAKEPSAISVCSWLLRLLL